jgi:hypothetical protein
LPVQLEEDAVTALARPRRIVACRRELAQVRDVECPLPSLVIVGGAPAPLAAPFGLELGEADALDPQVVAGSGGAGHRNKRTTPTARHLR